MVRKGVVTLLIFQEGFIGVITTHDPITIDPNFRPGTSSCSYI